MVFLPGPGEAAEINCSLGKCYSGLATWSQSVSFSFFLWCLAQQTSAGSEMPLSRDRAHYKQEKWSWAPLKWRFAGKSWRVSVNIGESAQYQEAEGLRGFALSRGRWKKANEKWIKCSERRQKRPVVYGWRKASGERRSSQGGLKVEKKEEDGY